VAETGPEKSGEPLPPEPTAAESARATDDLRYRPPRGTRTYDAWLIATFFGVGFTPKAPGTAGSAATVLLWALAAHFIPPDYQFAVALLVACVAIIVGIPTASIVCRESGLDDPQIVVIDEVAGQMLTLLLVPLGWKAFLAGFIIFRVFDMWKPFPLRRLEKLPEGSGVVMDDVGAGLYGLIVMQLLLYFHVL
jgi:phosphatidylglycerophosphatase A